MNNYDMWKTTDSEGEEDAAFNESVSEAMDRFEKQQNTVRQVMGNYDSDEYDRLDYLEAKAHVSDEWSAYIAEKKRIQAKWMRELAKKEVEAERFRRRGSSADVFANRLQNRG